MSVSTRINLRNVVNIVKNLFQIAPPPTPLGRWKICENKNINLVIDYANEDHCGSCSQYVIQVRNKQNNKNDTENELYSYDYECLLSNSNT